MIQEIDSIQYNVQPNNTRSEILKSYLITQNVRCKMLLLFCLIIPYVLTFQEYRKSQVLCLYRNNIYRNVLTQSLVQCAMVCDTDVGLCSRFIYKDKQCLLHTDKPAVSSTIMQTTDNWSLFFTKHKGLFMYVHVSLYIHVCFKNIINISLK